MSEKARITIDPSYQIAKIDDRIYGSFIEHLGRAVYTGIYQPGHISADEDGFRTDVLKLVRELNVPIVRYPGGNFVSNFFWEDSVGPLSERKPRLDLAWRTVESNQFGIDEFQKWCEKAGAQIMMAVNLGTRGTSDALNLLEYCNLDTDTKYAQMRRNNGHAKPYGIKTWCMGNEMDGPWQVGHKPAYEYGRLAAETAKAMKCMDDSLEFVMCGSSSVGMPTFPEWERITLDEAYDYIDYVSLHQYYGNQSGDTADYLASTLDLENFIHTVTCTIDFVKAKHHTNKKVNLSFDEWNVWYHSMSKDNEKMAREPWDQHPPLLEDHYDFEDALLVGLFLITFLRHADRIKIACMAQLVNVIAPIMTEADGGAWRQTIFYPFYQVSRYGRGISLECPISCGRHDTKNHGGVTDIDAAAVYNEENNEVTVFAVNRNTTEPVRIEVDLRGFSERAAATGQGRSDRADKEVSIIQHTEMSGFDVREVNTADNDAAVSPIEINDGSDAIDKGTYTAVLKPLSWNMIRFRI
jgi:alpha-N-arabinofuranosidase